MGNTTPGLVLPYPYDSDPADLTGIQALAVAVDARVAATRTAVDGALRRPSFHLTRSAVQNTTVGVTGLFVYERIIWDTSGRWNLATSATTMTINAATAGKWYLGAVCSPADPPSGTSGGEVTIRRNGAILARRKVAYASGVSAIEVSVEARISAGDTLAAGWTTVGGSGTTGTFGALFHGHRQST